MAGLVATAVSACSIPTNSGCAERWNESGARDQVSNAATSAAVTAQSAIDWEGGYDVCWVTFSLDDGTCQHASLALEESASWVVDRPIDDCPSLDPDGGSSPYPAGTFEQYELDAERMLLGVS